jgi:hypothetical protein
MATALSTARKKSIRDKLKAKIKSAGFKKGHVSKTTGKKISDVKPVKKKKAPTLSKSDPKYTKKMQARKHAKAVKKSLFKKPKSGAKSTAQKAFKEGAVKGKQVSHAKSKHKAWRTKAMAAAKRKTGAAKKKAMQNVDKAYRKKIGLKQKTYS